MEELGWRTLMNPFPQAYQRYPAVLEEAVPGSVSEQKFLLHRNHTSKASTATACPRFPVTHLPQDEPPGFGDPSLLCPASRDLHHLGVQHGQAERGGDPTAPRVDG